MSKDMSRMCIKILPLDCVKFSLEEARKLGFKSLIVYDFESIV